MSRHGRCQDGRCQLPPCRTDSSLSSPSIPRFRRSGKSRSQERSPWLSSHSPNTQYTIFYLTIGFYNLFFHPLSRFPGPLLARASSLWYARSLSRGTIAQDTLALHEKYGDVVRIAPDELSFINPESWSAIYGQKPGKSYRELIKDPRYHDTVKPTPTILTGDWDEHSMYRKMLSNSFSERALKDQEFILHRFVDLFIRRLHEASDGGREVNMTDWWNVILQSSLILLFSPGAEY